MDWGPNRAYPIYVILFLARQLARVEFRNQVEWMWCFLCSSMCRVK